MPDKLESRSAHTRHSTRWVSGALGIYVLLMYGIAYYGITAAAPHIAGELSVQTSSIFAVFSVAWLGSAMLAPHYGRWIDRVGAAKVLLMGALLRALVLAVMALAPNFYLFVAALLIVQLVNQACEYDAAFACAVDTAGTDARSVISKITLWGGFASTAFWPATAFLLEAIGWRPMMLLYAALMLAVCVPVAIWLRRIPRVKREVPNPAPAAVEQSERRWAIDGRFVLLAIAFASSGIAYNLPALMLPVLEGLGLGAMAVVAGMLFGPSQTAGRMFEMLYGSKVSALRVAVIASAVVTFSLIVLLAGGSAWSAIIFAVMFGAGIGVTHVVRGSVILALYGTGEYGTWLGRLGRVRLLVAAICPFLLAVLLDNYGPRTVVVVCAIAVSVSAVCFICLVRWRTN